MKNRTNWIMLASQLLLIGSCISLTLTLSRQRESHDKSDKEYLKIIHSYEAMVNKQIADQADIDSAYVKTINDQRAIINKYEGMVDNCIHSLDGCTNHLKKRNYEIRSLVDR